MKLHCRIARVRIGDYLFQTGDGRLLPAIAVTLGEAARASTCSFSINDPGNKIGAEFMKLSISQGGIITPTGLIDAPQASSNTSGNTNTSGVGGVSNADLTPEIRALLDAIALGEGTLNPNGYTTMFTGKQFSSFAQHPQQQNCSGGLCSDAAGRYQFLSTTWNGVAKQAGLADFSPSSQDLGAVQLLKNRGVSNAAVQGDLRTVIYGTGSETSGANKEWASLPGSPYGQPTKTYAEVEAVYTAALTKYRAQSPTTASGDGRSMVSKAPLPEVPTVATTPPVSEETQKGTEIIIELGFDSMKKLIAFHFIHTGTNISKGKGDITTFEGKTIRWLLTRIPQTTSYENVSLRQVAQIQAKAFNLDLEMEGDGPTYTFLDQTSLTPFQLLKREADRIGFVLKDDKTKLILEPAARPSYTSFVVDETTFISAEFGDRARGHIAQPGASVTDPGTSADQTKLTINRTTGQFKQLTSESKVGTAQQALVTGAQTTPVSGTLKPVDGVITPQLPAITTYPPTTKHVETENAQGKTIQDITTEVKEETGKITTVTTYDIQTIQGATTTRSKKVVTKVATAQGTETITQITQNNQTTTTTTKTSDVASAIKKQQQAPGLGSPTTEVDAFGLPKQSPGIIDLQDGRADGQAIADESKRVKGYESTLALVMTEEVLQLVPGEIIGLSGRLFPDPFNRQWRISEVKHDLENLTTTITLYTPQAPPPGGSTNSGSTAGFSSGSPTNLPIVGGWRWPISGNTCGPICEFGNARGRPHHGIDIGGGSGNDTVYAANNGVVDYAQNNGSGYGNLVILKHANGYETYYAHLASISVSVGQQVNVGQKIGVRGNTGGDFEIHLHFETRVGSRPVDPRTVMPTQGAPPMVG
jgi:murein DD-endopeptidase MepM/ murein hydrolase activator NlpD/muramidase (phage lysozyme)